MPRKKKPKPETEIRLGKLQESFLEDPTDRETFNAFFLLLKDYARSLTLKEIKSKVYLEPDRVEEIAVEAVLKLLDQYRRGKETGWMVWGSFAGALRWKVIEALYQDSDEESAQSLNILIGDSSTQELGDLIEKFGVTPLLSTQPQNPEEQLISIEDIAHSEIQGVIQESSEILSENLQILFLAYLLLLLRKPKARLKVASFKTIFLNSKSEEVFDLLMLEIRNRLQR